MVALVRTPTKAREVEALGAEAHVGDLLVPSSYQEVLRGCEVAVHLAQASADPLEEMRRVRVEGGRCLIQAAEKAGVGRLLVGSGYWVHGSEAGTIDEGSPVRPRHLSAVNYATEELGRRAVEEHRISEVVVARPGMVYGPGSWLENWLRELREGSFRFVGEGSNLMSPVHWEDAGRALLLLAKRGKGGSIYLVVDDDPVSVRDFATRLSRLVGAPAPTGLPLEQARTEWGEDLADLNAANRRASNRALRSLGWEPRFPSYQQGLPEVVRELRGGP